MKENSISCSMAVSKVETRNKVRRRGLLTLSSKDTIRSSQHHLVRVDQERRISRLRKAGLVRLLETSISKETRRDEHFL